MNISAESDEIEDAILTLLMTTPAHVERDWLQAYDLLDRTDREMQQIERRYFSTKGLVLGLALACIFLTSTLDYGFVAFVVVFATAISTTALLNSHLTRRHPLLVKHSTILNLLREFRDAARDATRSPT